MKETICTIVGVIGAWVAAFLGGWNSALGTLIIFMTVDFITGLFVAGVFHNSDKTESGSLNSHEGWKGLCKKGVMLLFVLIAHRLDLVIGTEYIRNTVIIGFIANELISIVENAGLMGIPIPKIIQKSIDVLQGKENDDGD